MSNLNSPYIPTSIYITNDGQDQKVQLTETLSLQAKAINRREIGFYDSSEYLTGQSWPPTSGSASTKRNDTFRKIVEVTIDSAAAPNTNSFAHGISSQSLRFTRISGAIGNGSNFIPLPYPGTDQTLLSVTSTDVVIANSTSAFNGYTGYVVLEYMKS